MFGYYCHSIRLQVLQVLSAIVLIKGIFPFLPAQFHFGIASPSY